MNSTVKIFIILSANKQLHVQCNVDHLEKFSSTLQSGKSYKVNLKDGRIVYIRPYFRKIKDTTLTIFATGKIQDKN